MTVEVTVGAAAVVVVTAGAATVVAAATVAAAAVVATGAVVVGATVVVVVAASRAAVRRARIRSGGEYGHAFGMSRGSSGRSCSDSRRSPWAMLPSSWRMAAPMPVVGLQTLHLVVEVAVDRVDLAELVAQLGEIVVLGEPGARREPEQRGGDRGRDDQGPEPEQPRRATLRGDPVAPVDAVATGTGVGDASPPGIRGSAGPRSGDGGGRAAAPIERLRIVDRVDRVDRRVGG